MQAWHLNPVRFENVIIRVYYIIVMVKFHMKQLEQNSLICLCMSPLTCISPTWPLMVLKKSAVAAGGKKYYILDIELQHVLGH